MPGAKRDDLSRTGMAVASAMLVCVVCAVALSPPALACLWPASTSPSPVMPGLQGATDVPTNARLMLRAPGAPWSALVVPDDDPDNAVAVLGDGEEHFEGPLQLRPSTAYTVLIDFGVVDGPLLPVTFATGEGDDEEEPARPPVRLERVVTPARWDTTNSCDNDAGLFIHRDGSTVLNVIVGLADDSAAALRFNAVNVVDDEADDRGFFSFRDGVSSGKDFGFGVVDRAGNLSGVEVVNIDYSGCSQTSLAPGAFALAVLLVLRRRR